MKEIFREGDQLVLYETTRPFSQETYLVVKACMAFEP